MSVDEKKQITPVVYSNTIMSMKILVEQATLLGEAVGDQGMSTRFLYGKKIPVVASSAFDFRMAGVGGTPFL